MSLSVFNLLRSLVCFQCVYLTFKLQHLLVLSPNTPIGCHLEQYFTLTYTVSHQIGSLCCPSLFLSAAVHRLHGGNIKSNLATYTRYVAMLKIHFINNYFHICLKFNFTFINK